MKTAFLVLAAFNALLFVLFVGLRDWLGCGMAILSGLACLVAASRRDL